MGGIFIRSFPRIFRIKYIREIKYLIIIKHGRAKKKGKKDVNDYF